MNHPIKDPATYRRMSEPLASSEEANKAVEAFFADLRAIREKHHMRDVVAVVQVTYVDNGEEALSTADDARGIEPEAAVDALAAIACQVIRRGSPLPGGAS